MNTTRRIPRPLVLLLAAILGALTLAGCGSTSGSGSDLYTPAAYYQSVNGVNDCYYVDDAGEALALIQAGLCPANSVAVFAPLTWREEYYDYYSSPAYYDTYMPVRYRSHYTSVTIVTFKSRYSTQITKMSSKAVYKSSTGQKVTGTSKLKFGTSSGSKSGTTVHGGGSGTLHSCSLPMTTLHDSSGSHGGGSGSSRTSGRTSSGSGSKGGC